MASVAEHPPEIVMAADDFQALEERVLRTVESLKHEREHSTHLAQRLDEQTARVGQLEAQLAGLHGERDAVRGRIERLLKTIDELGQ